ncbi:MAG: hypothetical protein HY460_02740, partial [Parcubacteria group bacterium]|nr:hypothetical protein [Parcubacteria group bacterium]
MKLFIRFFSKLLMRIARRVRARQKPTIVGVTGSRGKTSTKIAVAAVLQTTYRTGSDPKSYNNEIGLPLAIFGASSPGRDVMGWIRVVMRGMRLGRIIEPSYPEVLVLEYGADRPG